MDAADKIVNNKSPKRLILFFILLLVISAAVSWFVSAECADVIVASQIEATLSVSGGGRFGGAPDEAAIAAGEELYEKYGISRDTDPRLMANWINVRNVIFWSAFSLSGVICSVWLIFSIKQLFSIYNDLEALRLECLKVADNVSATMPLYGEELGCVRRISESVGLISVRMEYLTESLKKEKAFLKEFLTDFSHQLKTSLAVIRLNSDILSEMKNLTEKKKQQLSGEIEAHLDSMETLIISAIKLAKLNADAIEYSMTEAGISATCKEALDRISPLLRSRNMSFGFSAERDFEFAHDRVWLCEAIENIIKNSADHSECSSIKVELYGNPSAVTVAVEDNGKGIPQEEIPQLFERFGRKSGSVSMSSSGIGMSIAKKIVTAHNGEILLYSEPGKGTRFEIVFLK